MFVSSFIVTSSFSLYLISYTIFSSRSHSLCYFFSLSLVLFSVYCRHWSFNVSIAPHIYTKLHYRFAPKNIFVILPLSTSIFRLTSIHRNTHTHKHTKHNIIYYGFCILFNALCTLEFEINSTDVQ